MGRSFYVGAVADRAQRWKILFDGVDDVDDIASEWDDVDESERVLFVQDVFGLQGAQAATQVALLTQLLDDQPPFVWENLQRHLDAGQPNDVALSQLRLVLLTVLHDAVAGSEYDDDEYRRRLERLPLPDADTIEDAFDRIAAARGVLPIDELDDAVMAELGGRDDDRVLRNLVERVGEELVEGFGPLQWLSGNRTVHRRTLTDGIVLTHEVTEYERQSDRLEVDVDLAGFVGLIDPSLSGAEPDDEIMVLTDGQWTMSWLGPDGWLEPYPAGSVIAVRVDSDEMVTVEALADRPAADPVVVELLRRVVKEEVEEPGLPVTAAEVVLAILAEEREVFSAAQAPLRDLCAAAGLELRGTEIGDDPDLWRNASHARRYRWLYDRTDGDDVLAKSVLDALSVCDRLLLDEEVTPDEMAEALDSLADQDVMDLVGEELFRADADPPPTPDLFTSLARPASGRALAAVHTLAAIAAEHDGDPLIAAQHLELALEADPTHAVAIDRLAWYASDQGDAVKATRLWSNLDGPSIRQSLAELQPFARHAGSGSRGRNERCWCGSGRKYKHCHLGEPELAPLPDRVGWLCRKAVQYLERQGQEPWESTYDVAMALADEDPARLPDVFDDPIVLDLVLTEGGWFEEFLADRGPLLPEDEALLAASWLTVDRSVHEVVEVHRGERMRVRDLRSGEVLDVRERTFTQEAQPGMLVCARAVPDGETNQFVGAVLTVPVGQEAQVLDLLDEGEPTEIAVWVASLSRPPQLRTREGEPVVQCEIVVEADDAQALVSHLDRTYQVDEVSTAWSEHHDLDGIESVVRASFHLDDDRLTISTNSHERADRILDRLHEAVAVTVLSDTRTPVDLSAGIPGGDGRPAGLPDLRSVADTDLDTMELDDLNQQIADQFERRWCDEAVPALGGLTPRQAAADPTRREQVIRLIASFENQPTPAGAITMRPHRLRALLDL